MSYLNSLHEALQANLKEQTQCVSDYGHVLTGKRTQYQQLVKRASVLRNKLETAKLIQLTNKGV